jgi:hypothetical protein
VRTSVFVAGTSFALASVLSAIGVGVMSQSWFTFTSVSTQTLQSLASEFFVAWVLPCHVAGWVLGRFNEERAIATAFLTSALSSVGLLLAAPALREITDLPAGTDPLAPAAILSAALAFIATPLGAYLARRGKRPNHSIEGMPHRLRR